MDAATIMMMVLGISFIASMVYSSYKILSID